LIEGSLQLRAKGQGPVSVAGFPTVTGGRRRELSPRWRECGCCLQAVSEFRW